MSPEELDAIEARANAAEAGPWTVVFKPDDRPTVCTTAHFRVARCESWAHDHTNVVFIARARTDVPALVAEVRRLRADVATQAAAVRAHDAAQAVVRAAEHRAAQELWRRLAAPADTLAQLSQYREEAERWNARATELEAERDALRGALKGVHDVAEALAHGARHADGCPALRASKCTCGLEETEAKLYAEPLLTLLGISSR